MRTIEIVKKGMFRNERVSLNIPVKWPELSPEQFLLIAESFCKVSAFFSLLSFANH